MSGRDKWEWNGRRWLAPTRPPPSDRPIEEQIAYYARYGFRVQYQTATTAQLVRPKSFSFVWASLWFIFGFGIGIFFYLFYYMSKQDEMRYLEVRPAA